MDRSIDRSTRRPPARVGLLASLGAMLVLGACATERRITETEAFATPVLEAGGLPDATRAGRVTFAAQPTEDGIRRFAAEGGGTVVDLRTHEGRDVPGFDERGLVESLGLRYVSIPVSSSTLSPADTDRFHEVLEGSDAPVLLHCGTSNRAGGLWAAYLARHHGWDVERAIEAGRAAGLRSEPVEEAARRAAGK
jgi:uncharacterized protein (TIGR01244 family)